jgi:hypothetical protein
MSNEESFATQEPVEVVLISEEDGDAIETLEVAADAEEEIAADEEASDEEAAEEEIAAEEEEAEEGAEEVAADEDDSAEEDDVEAVEESSETA